MILCEPITGKKVDLISPLSEEMEVFPGVPFGRQDQLLSAAYWQWRCGIGEEENHDYVSRGGTLRDEVAFCLLGGYGIKLEANEAFFQHLKGHGIFDTGVTASEEDIFKLLSDTIPVVGRPQRYRFPRQKAGRLVAALNMIDQISDTTMSDLSFRAALNEIPGIGPKTASWITRNWLGSDNVAILDVHVLRAGCFLGIFDDAAHLPRHYLKLESNFLQFAEAINVRASVLDAVMWLDMRMFGSRLVSQNGS
ncbi:hypothetical protein [Sulfitobacter sp.]|uniref:8-oxoguanine DNA glycosylase n=1 Tax=Sulfitobacter sp. TaxID=1903071 RepID=UPI00356333EE